MLLSIKIFLKIYNNILSWIFVPFIRENQQSDERIKIFPMVINAGNKRFLLIIWKRTVSICKKLKNIKISIDG